MGYYNVIIESNVATDPDNTYVNVLQYVASDPVPNSLEINAFIDAFVADIIEGVDGLLTILSAGMIVQRVIATCPPIPSLLAVRTVVETGLRGGTQMPRFVAWGFKAERSVGDIRSGFKRFGKISEADTAGDAPTAAMLVLLDAFAENLTENVRYDYGAGMLNASPVIVKRIKYTAPSGNPAYRLPEAGDTLNYMPAVWTFDAITTQNSRKS
jgi:hypothetical protein